MTKTPSYMENVYRFLRLRTILHISRRLRRLPEDHDNEVRQLREQLSMAENSIAALREELTTKVDEAVRKLITEDKATKSALAGLRSRLITHSPAVPGQSESQQPRNAVLDQFYEDLKDTFRGTRRSVIDELRTYRYLFKDLPSGARVLDVGCGRGEMLEVLKLEGVEAEGVDPNQDAVDMCKGFGLDARKGDALKFLEQQKDGSVTAITGLRFVEYISFPDLHRLFNLCYSKLGPDGFVLFETPNPDNLRVGASRFFVDPARTRPIPAELMEFCAKSAGFTNIEIHYLNPEKQIPDTNTLQAESFKTIFGPRIYAIVAKK